MSTTAIVTKIFLVIIGLGPSDGWDKIEQPSWDVCIERKIFAERYLKETLKKSNVTVACVKETHTDED
jgi:hypothetical protein